MPLQKIIECCDDYGAGSMDASATANLEAANAAAVSEIHLYVRGLYTVPFVSVPDEIASIAAQLTKVQLYYRRAAEEVPESIAALHKRLQEQLKGITESTFRIERSEGDPEAAAQGPRVSKTFQRFPQGFQGGLLDENADFDLRRLY
jgi:phage gp36-like protein